MTVTTRRGFVARASTGAAVGVLGGAVIGCWAGTTPGGAPAQPSGPVTIQFWHWGTPDYRTRELRVVDAFQQKFPKITVDVATLQYGDLVNKLPTSFAGDVPPDTFIMDMPWVQDYGPRGWVLDLNEMLRRDKGAYGNAYKSAPLGKLAFEIMSWKNVLTGIPSGTGPNLFYYNAELFRSAGLKTPAELYKADQWTWEAFLDAAQRLTKRKGDQIDVAGFDQGLHRLWMNAAGSEEFDSYQAPKKCLYDSPAAITALRFLQDSRIKQRVQPLNFSKEIGMDSTKAFVAGKVAMMARWSSGIGVFKDIDNFKWGMVPYPKKAAYAVDYATSGMALSKNAKHHDAAWAWNNFSVGPDGGRESATDGTGVPFHPDTQKVTLDAQHNMKMLETPGFHIDVLRSGKFSHVRLLSKDQDKIQKEFIGPATGKIFQGQESPDTAAKELVTQLNDWLAKNPQAS